ncbi:hypothetical protein BKA65DRAFT_539807 [Rhexocercosporidium sp. MPI-PUGE-AT-0058]|nr:hypothetical protein BKA65DRAFT_539807 [Rhexocercosporidium sp. MPI-PUGE-AT-0058]
MELTTLLPTLISTLLISTSIPLIAIPVTVSKNYIHIETPQAIFYARQLGTRNLMLGSSIAYLTYTGNLSGAATVLCTFPFLGFLDPLAGWLYRGRLVKNDWNHLLWLMKSNVGKPRSFEYILSRQLAPEAPRVCERILLVVYSSWFRDEKIFQLERREIFSKYWYITSFVARFEKPGNYLTLEMFGWPFCVIKDKMEISRLLSVRSVAFGFRLLARMHFIMSVDIAATLSQPIIRFGHSLVLSIPRLRNLHIAREYTDLTNFDPSAHTLFKIHTHITAQGFIFVNFDSSPITSIPFTTQFREDFNPSPSSQTDCVIGNEHALLPFPSEWTYHHTWQSSSISTNYHWKTEGKVISYARFWWGVEWLSEIEHAVKWYQDKDRKTFLEHKEIKINEGKIVNYAMPIEQGTFEDADELMGPEFEW